MDDRRPLTPDGPSGRSRRRRTLGRRSSGPTWRRRRRRRRRLVGRRSLRPLHERQDGALAVNTVVLALKLQSVSAYDIILRDRRVTAITAINQGHGTNPDRESSVRRDPFALEKPARNISRNTRKGRIGGATHRTPLALAPSRTRERPQGKNREARTPRPLQGAILTGGRGSPKGDFVDRPGDGATRCEGGGQSTLSLAG